MTWIALAILGLIFAISALIILRSNSKAKESQEDLIDRKEFREELVKWEPLVLERFGTMRDVKRFANRARFLTADQESGAMVSSLVGLVALEEIGCIDPSVNKFDFEKWKQGELWILVKSGFTEQRVSAIENWLKTLEEEDWRHYQALTTGGRPQSSGRDGYAADYRQRMGLT